MITKQMIEEKIDEIKGKCKEDEENEKIKGQLQSLYWVLSKFNY